MKHYETLQIYLVLTFYLLVRLAYGKFAPKWFYLFVCLMFSN